MNFIDINVVPPNKTSLAFHLKHGFSEVGRQRLQSGTKQVSMQVKFL
jgi:predicted GNAT superfamily acetyltransferase